MAEPQIIPLQQPLKGLVKSLALSDQPPGTVIDSRDVFPRDAKTGRLRLSVRPGYSAVGDFLTASSSQAPAGFAILGNAFDESGGIQLFGFSSGRLIKWTGSAWSNAGSITSSTSRTIHGASYGTQLFIACNAPYKYYDYDPNNDGDPSDATIASWTATAGTIPPNCRIVASYASRAVLLADPDHPNIINFSRTDDWFDWDFTAEDSGTAVSVAIDEAATCGFEHNRQCFIVGTKHGMWIFRGNPAAQNAIREKFAFVLGPVNSTAWCKSADDWTYMMAHNGLYRMAPGCGAPPEAVSRDRIPEELLGCDGVNTKAYLAYNERFRVVEIHLQGTNASSWAYDVDGGGFWKISAPGTGILAAIRFGPLDSTTASGTLIATSTNVMRLNNAQALGGSDKAYATMLFPLAPIGMKGMVQKNVLHFSSNTNDNPTVAFHGGATAELAAALSADRKAEATAAELAANNGTWYPRVGGTFEVLKITQDDTAEHWSVEGGSLFVEPNGIERG